MCSLCPCTVSPIVNILHLCGMFVVQPFCRDAGFTRLRQSRDENLSLSGPKTQECGVVGQGHRLGCLPCCGAVKV